MICKICGKPLFNNKCLYCGHKRDAESDYGTLIGANGEELGYSDTTGVTPSSSFVEETSSGYQSTGFSTPNADNQLATIGMILAICSFLCMMLTTPALIISIVALVKSNSLNGAGRTKAIVGVVISSIVILLYILFVAFVIFINNVVIGIG